MPTTTTGRGRRRNRRTRSHCKESCRDDSHYISPSSPLILSITFICRIVSPPPFQYRHNSQLMRAVMEYYENTAGREDMCSENVLTHRFSSPLGLTLRGWTITNVGPGAARKKRIKKGWSIRDINGEKVPDDTAVIKLLLATARDVIRITFYKKRPPNDHWEALLAKAVRNEKLVADVTFTKSVLGIRLSGRVVTFVDPKRDAAEKGVRPGWKVNMVDGHLGDGANDHFLDAKR
mmetsp:Transcript_33536/g.56864  ORF Transcript_33536/g.56864 Transcript_33536/m.56864 type:complete len:234 (+) Transcript_33536:999-1700(+)